ncbi:protein kinase STUNTED-like [Impatiens glandulifera]|uniref:protein kinase STUNTED-like n=1 Tax=Impatiens glandulifera TaxID=253017 RepID=UPI001FB12DA5|nr:protein kinase STUNTED-like [Impatiens glandulifera]
MTQNGRTGECGEMERVGRTVVVGVKLDSQSKELLNWALVKVAGTGDRVIAIHVLNNKVDRDGKSSLMSMVEGFDTVLAVYEGFCELKQVDLKLKICRGSSIQKVLVREAISYLATDVVVGIAQTHHTIRSSKSVAKYCARKLSKNCSIIAVDNGKIVFKRESCKSPISRMFITEEDDHNRTVLLGLNQTKPTKENVQSSTQKSNCVICSTYPQFPKNLHPQSKEFCDEEFSGFQWGLDSPFRHCSSNENFEFDERNGSLVVPSRSECLTLQSSPCPSFSGLPEELEGFLEKYSSVCRLFTYQELQQATSNFMPENLIGTGGSSRVYRGSLLDGKEVAVKMLNPFEDAIKEFRLEIEMITALNHKNIILLSGFCLEDTNLLLVYDFLPRGNLEENLHSDDKASLGFGWKERYKVALGIAEALAYLHIEIEKPMIHRDVKSSNILLSNDFEPQLSDFGLAKWSSIMSSDMDCSDVAGTFGYLAPEYFMYGKVNEKIDVYAFGVVLLELVSGRKPINSDLPKGQDILVLWAERILNDGKISELVDPRLGSDYDFDQMKRMVLAASLCIRRAPGARPCMDRVLKLLLEEEGDIDEIIEMNGCEERREGEEEEEFNRSKLQSHLNLVFQDGEDDSLSMSSMEQNFVSIEDYLKGRCSRESSFA